MIEPLILESINYCKENEKPIPCNTKFDGKLISVEPFNNIPPFEIKILEIGKVRTKRDGNKIFVNDILFTMFSEQSEILERYYKDLQEIYDNESDNYSLIIENIIMKLGDKTHAMAYNFIISHKDKIFWEFNSFIVFDRKYNFCKYTIEPNDDYQEDKKFYSDINVFEKYFLAFAEELKTEFNIDDLYYKEVTWSILKKIATLVLADEWGKKYSISIPMVKGTLGDYIDKLCQITYENENKLNMLNPKTLATFTYYIMQQGWVEGDMYFAGFYKWAYEFVLEKLKTKMLGGMSFTLTMEHNGQTTISKMAYDGRVNEIHSNAKIDFEKNEKYIRLKNYVIPYINSGTLTPEQAEEILSIYISNYFKKENKLDANDIMDYITENYPEYISYVDIISSKTPMQKYIYVYYQEDMDIVNKIFSDCTLIPTNYFEKINGKEVVISIILIPYLAKDNQSKLRNESYNKSREKGYLPLNLFKKRMIRYAMAWLDFDINDNRHLGYLMKVSRMSIIPIDEGWSKEWYREDLKCAFRSTWEANIARLLNYKNIKWNYEAETINLDLSKEKVKITPTYIPDFKLEDNSLIEVKGFWDIRSKAKMKFVKEQYTDRKILVIDSDLYTCIQRKYSSIVDNWEEDKPTSTDDIIQVVGITIPNRKSFVAALTINEEINLVRDENNEYDSNAIMVTNKNGNQIGFIAKDCASIFAPKMDMGFKYKLTVNSFEPKVIQCNIKLINHEELILPDIFK